MVSATMAVQEEHGCRGLDSHILKSGKTSLDSTATKVKDKEQLSNAGGADFVPKARKPYTITKQREKWSEEEHKKFLKALKLYGRAWRKIEEHVGTKTAVQIRSHAQKFFSKIDREAKNGDGNSVKPIEIPPPRPKRRPMHPYPRKMVSGDKTVISPPDKFPNAIEQENQSFTSVLSGLGSDSSCTPNGNRSSVSSEVPKLVSEDVMSVLPEGKDENSSTNERDIMGLSAESENSLVKEDSSESTTQSFKLFGKMVLITGPCGPSDPAPKTCKPELPSIDYESPKAVGLLTHPISFPWESTLWGDSAFVENPEVHSPTPIRARSICDLNNNHIRQNSGDNDKEGSFSGSSTVDLANEPFSFERERGGVSLSFCKKRTSGFMPYRRCSDEQDSTLLAAENNEQRETQRFRLCL